jgi:CheY-like chemotaxis protein
VRLRCSKCEAVFRITPPPVHAEAAAEERPAAPVQQAAAPPAPQEQAVVSGAELTSAVEPRSEEQRRRLVLLADAEVEAGKALANTLAGWGLEPVLVHDGVEAILTIQRILPRVVILDAGLPKMFGFQVCELMKRNEGLRAIHVVLVGAIYHQDRYRRAPSELYGADAYVERPQLPEALRPILRGFGLDVGGAAPESAVPPAAPVPEAVAPPAAPAPAPEVVVPPAAPAPAVPPAPEPALQPAPEPASPEAPQPSVSAPPQAADAEAAPDPAVTNAERLARIIVSDIVLYNPEKFEAGIRDGNVLEALEAEVEEGRSHFEQRVELRVRESRDFLADEIVRVARLRGMK